MGTRPTRPGSSHKVNSTEIRRIAKISQFERVDPSPDNLTLLKRKVDEFDVLETDDPPEWETAVGAISDENYRKLFQGGNMDRLRFRYQAYGWDNATIERMLTDLTTALP